MQNDYHDRNQPDIFMAFLGFFIPIAGIAIYFALKYQHPGKASSAGKGAAISIVFSVALFIIVNLVIAAIYSKTATGIY